jgi:hypothetical protein
MRSYPDETMIKRLSLLIVILLLCTAVVESFHYHDDGANHSDCSICVASHLNSDTVLSSPVVPVLRSITRTVYLLPTVTVVTKVCFSPANSRAPPA